VDHGGGEEEEVAACREEERRREKAERGKVEADAGSTPVEAALDGVLDPCSGAQFARGAKATACTGSVWKGSTDKRRRGAVELKREDSVDRSGDAASLSSVF
jgi:hypothetical protein